MSHLLAWTPPLAQLGGSGGEGPWQFLLTLGAFCIGTYALIIHPQRKQQREHEKMLRQIQRGDQVITTGGIHGKVMGVADDVLTLEVAERVRIRVSRSAIGVRVPATAAERSAAERTQGERDRGEREKEKKA